MSSIDAAADRNMDPVNCSESSVKAKRISQYSWIRVIACFAIVLLHTLDGSLSYFGETVTENQAAAVRAASGLLMWAVPCFLMVTGALLLDPARELTMKKLFGKYIRRMVLALIVFTFIFTVIKFAAGEKDDIIVSCLRDLIQCTSMSYLWYLYLMIGLYLMMPFYRMITAAASEKMLRYLVLLLIVFTSLMPLLGYVGLESGFYIPTDVIYPAYLFIGYLLSRNNMGKGKAIALLVTCGALLAILAARVGGGDVDMDALTGYGSPLVVGMSAGVFSLMMRIRAGAGEVLSSIDRCSFGIYLIHMIGVRLVMKELGISPYDFGPFGFAGMAIIFFLVSYAITWGIRKLPGNLL